MNARTSETHPLRIDVVTVAATGGQIGITFCPGKKQTGALTGSWDRNLELDMQCIADWAPDAMVTLIEHHEFEALDVVELPLFAEHLGLEWHHLPIRDMDVPSAAFEERWPAVGDRLKRYLGNGGLVLVHCKGGLGRAGTIAARLLIEMGEPSARAIQHVRAARRGAIETGTQEAFLYSLQR
jgi:ADP-ribosyl-[dinitrogen reductase] hydrolase